MCNSFDFNYLRYMRNFNILVSQFFTWNICFNVTHWACIDGSTPSLFMSLNQRIRYLIYLLHIMCHDEQVKCFLLPIYLDVKNLDQFLSHCKIGQSITIKEHKCDILLYIYVVKFINVFNHAIKVIHTSIHNSFGVNTIISCYPHRPLLNTKFIFVQRVSV